MEEYTWENFVSEDDYKSWSSFGKRTPGCTRRTSECLTLEPSEMIVIDYPDVHLLKGGPRHLCSNMSVDRVLPKDHEDMKICRMHSETCTEQLPPDLAHVQTMFSRTDHCLREQYLKRNSRASDTSSAYSGSDMMQSSIDDQENVDMDLSGLTESMVDSEEEEGYAEPPESYHTQDLVNECLEKPADQRNSNDIDTLLDFMRHFSAFANMTLATRQALCAVMVFAPIKEAGTIVMKDGEELDSWSIILNGEVEITWPDGQKKILGMGNSFGVAPVLEKQYHSGEMKTRVEDCQFVCVTQSDYYRILHQGEENTRKHEEKGHVVMVTEHRVLDGGSRKGHIVIRGTPERLMQHLIEEEHSTVDPTYVEDFLLTYRTFLTSPTYLASRLLSWFNSHDMGVSNMKMKVARVVLLWVNNHFNDFETDGVMCEFLEQFEHLLEQEKLGGQLRLLYLACSSKAHPRTITLTRATREELLHFCVIGGVEKGTGIFVSKVEKCSKAYDAGLKRGDQVLEVNGINFEGVSHSRALEVLRGTTHLSITVKSNLSDFKQLLCTPERTSRCTSKDDSMKLYTDHKQRLSAPDLELSIPSVIKDKKHDKKEKEKGFMTFTNKPKIRKALKKINFIPKSLNNIDSNMNHSDESLYTKPSRKSSTSSSTSSSTTGMSSHLSLSNPDLLSVGLIDESKQECPEYVLKVYRSDQTYKFLPIHKETQAREVVMLALQEFAITDPSSNYSLCEVTVNAESLTKQKRLPEHLNNLSDRLNLNGRYYLKNNMSTDTLVPEEIMNELIKESQTSLLQLNTMELASQLTLADFEVFREIEPTEYIDKLFSIKSKFGCANIEKFSQLVNREMFWVVTEVCREPNVVKRMKTIKHFIKIAKHCKECKNFNSMFAIISGLGHGSVSRLRNTWDRLPNKYLKMFQDLQDLMNPLRNMAKYRSLISPENTQPPMLPFFPVIIKDLTFIHEGNDSLVDSLINFEKLRMIAREIRHICDMRSARYDVSSMYLNPHSVYGSSTISSVATLKRTKNRRGSAIPNSKKMFEESQMIKRVKSYLRQMPITTEEDKLQEMSLQCEPPARRRDTSPALNISGQIGTNTTADDKRPIISGPKFGSESPEAVQKLLALTDKVRPHNCKHPLPSVSSPVSTRHPTSPWQTRSIPVLLSHESSSVVSMSNLARHPSRTGSIGSSESASPTSSLSSSYQHPYETDSGHNSIASSNFDSRSTSSVGSSNSPPAPRWSGHLPQTVAINCLPLQSSTPTRPPLPPYHVVVQNAPAYSHCIQQANTNFRRPPLPDYHSAAQMAHLARQKQLWQMERAHSHEGLLGYYNEGEFEAAEDADEEQVSAV